MINWAFIGNPALASLLPEATLPIFLPFLANRAIAIVSEFVRANDCSAWSTFALSVRRPQPTHSVSFRFGLRIFWNFEAYLSAKSEKFSFQQCHQWSKF